MCVEMRQCVWRCVSVWRCHQCVKMSSLCGDVISVCGDVCVDHRKLCFINHFLLHLTIAESPCSLVVMYLTCNVARYLIKYTTCL